MHDTITLLECEPGKLLAKTYTADGRIRDYDAGFLVRATELAVASIEDLGALLESLSDTPDACVIRGAPKEGAVGVWVPRRSNEAKYGEENTPFVDADRHWLAVDADDTIVPAPSDWSDAAQRDAAISAWRQTLPPELRAAAFVWQWSAKAHTSPTVRGRAWFWLKEPVDNVTLRAWADAHGYDDSHYTPVAIHYTAAPTFEDSAGPDPLAGVRVCTVTGAPSARLNTAALPERKAARREARGGYRAADIPDDTDERVALVLATLGDSRDYAGDRHHMCLAVGGVMRKWGLSARTCEGVIRAWLAPSHAEDRTVDVDAGVETACKAWLAPVEAVSGYQALEELIGEEHAQLVYDGVKEARYCKRPSRTDPAPTPETATRFVSVSERDAREDSDDTDEDGDGGTQPLLCVVRSDPSHMFLYESDDAGLQPVAPGALRLRIKEMGLETLVPLHTERGRPLLPGEIAEACGTTVREVVYDWHSTRSVYDADADRLVRGYPVPSVLPAFDLRVDAWLRALAGDDYARLETWIASCAQHNIDRLAAAVVFVGPKDLGKSLFATSVARLWGVTKPPVARLLTSRFNGDLMRCPIVFDDESQLFGSRELSTKKFRDVVQETERNIEKKGREVFALTGALRLIVSCNDVGDLRFTDVSGPDVVDAVRDRLLVIDAKPRAAACRAALASLRLPGAWLVDVDAISAHLAWIVSEVDARGGLPAERFLGAGGEYAEHAVLAGHVDAHAEVWETLHGWAESAPRPSKAGDAWAWSAGELHVAPNELAAALEWELAEVHAALAPFVTGRGRPRLLDGTQPRMLRVDAARVADAARVDLGALLSWAGSARRPSIGSRAQRRSG